MGGSDDDSNPAASLPSEAEIIAAQRARERECARAIVEGYSGPTRADAPLHRGVIHSHALGTSWARTLLRIHPLEVPGERVWMFCELGRARRRCARVVGHCFHPFGGPLDWCCCVCGEPVDHPGPADRCRLCSHAASIGAGAGVSL